MRHTVTIEFLNKVEVHDKLLYFNAISTAEDLHYSDITSANKDEVITAYFSIGEKDMGRIVFEQKVMKISVSLSFQSLIDLNNFTHTHYGELVKDLLNPPVEEDEPLITA